MRRHVWWRGMSNILLDGLYQDNPGYSRLEPCTHIPRSFQRRWVNAIFHLEEIEKYTHFQQGTSKSPRCRIHNLSSWSSESWIPYCKIISKKGTPAKVLYPSRKSSQRDGVPLKGLPIPLHDQKARCQQLVHPVKAEIFYM